MFYVYSYTDVKKNEVFYIGKGCDDRLRVHLSNSKNPNDKIYNGHFYRKLRKMQQKNQEIRVDTIAETKDEKQAFDLEIQFINAFGRISNGGTLCNATDGGEGTLGMVHSRKSKKAIAKSNIGRKMPESAKEKIRQAALAQHADLDSKINSEATRELLRIKATEQNSQYWKGKTRTQETKDRISKKVQAAIARGEGPCSSPSLETRKKMSDAQKGNTHAKGAVRSQAERNVIRDRMLGNSNFKGKHHSEASCDKMGKVIIAVKPDDSELRFETITKLRTFLGQNGVQNILKSCKSGLPLTKGTHCGWRYYFEGKDNGQPVLEKWKGMPRSRPEALSKGAKFYFTGTPCKYGHISARKVKGTCLECLKPSSE